MVGLGHKPNIRCYSSLQRIESSRGRKYLEILKTWCDTDIKKNKPMGYERGKGVEGDELGV